MGFVVTSARTLKSAGQSVLSVSNQNVQASPSSALAFVSEIARTTK